MSTAGPASVDSKSAKKRKAKTENAPSSSGAATPVVEATTNGVDSHTENQYIKDLTRNIRNIHKKLAASSKADAVISENPNMSLDDLVAAKKLNTDQKAQILKKPILQAQLTLLEEQLNSFRAYTQELEDRFAKEKSSLVEAHEAEMVSIKEKVVQEMQGAKAKVVEDSLRTVTHFLHAAASKRQSEEADSEEGRAFEGALLLVYQGNEASLTTLKNLINGTEDKVPDVQGEVLDFTFAQVKQSALRGAQDLVPSMEQVADETEQTEPSADATEIKSDATIANAALTELGDTTTIQTPANDAAAEPEALPVLEQASTGANAANAVAEATWDPQASIVTDTSATNEEWVQVSRDPAETDTGVNATPAAVHGASNWAEEVGAATEEKPAAENDGFEQVRRERGRGRGGRGGRGDFRGRGRGGRGDGYRSSGRGGAPRGRGGPRGEKS
ncbi:uncharacterized protein Z518_11180 [Rhinocladiella mackenziei CBS 650.93]|uniref:YAG7-like dimerisation domain-containing protein n=1 Tax=Rhinocladiella mackenziei CBS 650.93 TaxID=1442369 RepID=A0A0D2FBH3_9EURO|nr:uncharacterized protein Z518_11180 [Rhinocladiella mackenziei CBS 650.93]KIW99441.1 hypothetical protein Z518_11180 [Rhinocladiella mackenziei CBS 650.93]